MKQFITMTFLVTLGSLNVVADTLYPSIYYSPVINRQTMQCEEDKVHQVIDKNQNVLETLCHSEFKQCQFQGSCIILDDKKRTVLNFVSYNETTEQTFFTIINNQKCFYGVGVKGACLDPFYSVAADLTKHKLGDVLYIPKIKGTQLPNGETHNGFVIVRDSSRLLVGAGAGNIVFFTGSYSSESLNNPFVKLEMDDLDKTTSFRKATSIETQKIKKQRNYPFLKNDLNKESNL